MQFPIYFGALMTRAVFATLSSAMFADLSLNRERKKRSESFMK